MAISDYATCLDCTTLHLKSSLSGSRCAVCHGAWIEKRNLALAKASDRALATAAREILLGVAAAGKGEPMTPSFAEAAIRKLGGVETFADICAGEFQKCRGCDADGNPIPNAKQMPSFTFKWAELITRTMSRADEIQTLDVANLSEDDLIATLRGLATDLVQSNSEYRRLIVEEALRVQPDLINKAMDAAGMPVVEAEEVEEVIVSDAGIDESDASEDEYYA